MDRRAVPAFYCCYLLRSTKRKAWLYVGSTPNPTRRLAQHNGSIKGGAAKTSKETMRPWEMVCVVTGFPSSLAALQFEWTWQNPHLTRRIPSSQRLILPESPSKYTTRTGKPRKRPLRPCMSLKDRLANLHLLLRVPSFARWPLEVRFFSDDVYQAWLQRLESSRGADAVEAAPLREGMRVTLDTKQPLPGQPEELGRGGGIAGLDVSYAPLKAYLDKSQFLLADGEVVSCAVCKGRIQTPTHMALVCPSPACRAASHVTCLSTDFLRQEGKGGDDEVAVPLGGNCPACGTSVRWVDVVREMTLRMRGEKEVALLMKKKKGRVRKAKGGGAEAREMVVPDTDEDLEAELELEEEEEEEDDDEGDDDGDDHDINGINDDDDVDNGDEEEVLIIEHELDDNPRALHSLPKPTIPLSNAVDSDSGSEHASPSPYPSSSPSRRAGGNSPARAIFRMPPGLDAVEIEDSECEAGVGGDDGDETLEGRGEGRRGRGYLLI